MGKTKKGEDKHPHEGVQPQSKSAAQSAGKPSAAVTSNAVRRVTALADEVKHSDPKGPDAERAPNAPPEQEEVMEDDSDSNMEKTVQASPDRETMKAVENNIPTIRDFEGVLWISPINLQVPDKDKVLDSWILHTAKQLSLNFQKYVIYFPRAIPDRPRLMLNHLGQVTPLRTDNRLFLLTVDKALPPALSRGFFIVSHSVAFIRPFVEKTQWKQQRRHGTLLLRGPKSEKEITDWWPKLQEQGCSIKRRGKTWFISSPYRKKDAPAYKDKNWAMVPAGACFRCGKLGHSEKHCRCGLCKCKNCRATDHTMDACPYRNKELTGSEASEELKAISAKVKSLEKVPAPLLRLINEANKFLVELKVQDVRKAKSKKPISRNSRRNRGTKNKTGSKPDGDKHNAAGKAGRNAGTKETHDFKKRPRLTSSDDDMTETDMETETETETETDTGMSDEDSTQQAATQTDPKQRSMDEFVSVSSDPPPKESNGRSFFGRLLGYK